MPRGIEVIFGPKQIEIRLWFIVLIQSNGTLHSDNSPISHNSHQRLICAKHRCAMTRSDRTHRENLASDEFHSIVFGQNAGVDHSMVIVNGEQPP